MNVHTRSLVVLSSLVFSFLAWFTIKTKTGGKKTFQVRACSSFLFTLITIFIERAGDVHCWCDNGMSITKASSGYYGWMRAFVELLSLMTQSSKRPADCGFMWIPYTKLIANLKCKQIDDDIHQQNSPHYGSRPMLSHRGFQRNQLIDIFGRMFLIRWNFSSSAEGDVRRTLDAREECASLLRFHHRHCRRQRLAKKEKNENESHLSKASTVESDTQRRGNGPFGVISLETHRGPMKTEWKKLKSQSNEKERRRTVRVVVVVGCLDVQYTPETEKQENQTMK